MASRRGTLPVVGATKGKSLRSKLWRSGSTLHVAKNRDDYLHTNSTFHYGVYLNEPR